MPEPRKFIKLIIKKNNKYIKRKNVTYTPKVWENNHVDSQIFNKRHWDSFLIIISFNSTNSKKLTPKSYNK